MAHERLTPEIMLNAYASGIFPMAETRDDPEVFWVDPRFRGVMPLDGFRMSRSLAKRIRRDDYEIHIDESFADVVAACADREETWINDTLFGLYGQLHKAGFAHSIEVWIDDELAGGMFGLTLGGAFFGESMFSRKRDASKIAMAYLVDRLRQGGFRLFDTQFLTEHLQSLGAVEIPRADYHKRLERALDRQADFNEPQTPTPYSLLQRNTQTS